MTKQILNCFKCSKELENFDWSRSAVHPNGGLHFITHGHYGSRVFDSMNGTILNIVLCDECVIGAIEHVYAEESVLIDLHQTKDYIENKFVVSTKNGSSIDEFMTDDNGFRRNFIVLTSDELKDWAREKYPDYKNRTIKELFDEQKFDVTDDYEHIDWNFVL